MSQEANMSERKTGLVKWFDERKGYGFITPDGGGEDIFVHKTGILDVRPGFQSLTEGDKVEFETEQGPKGLNAVNVKILS